MAYITFRDIDFRYGASGPLIVRGFSLDIGRGELTDQPGEHGVMTETAQVGVEVAPGRHEVADLDTRLAPTCTQPFRRHAAGHVAVARDIDRTLALAEELVDLRVAERLVRFIDEQVLLEAA